jgi:hypothetical protein
VDTDTEGVAVADVEVDVVEEYYHHRFDVDGALAWTWSKFLNFFRPL